MLAYAAIGGIVALAFLLIGLDRIDPAAAGAYAFRPLLIPGLMLLWPVAIVCWVRRQGSGGRGTSMRRRHRSAHLRIWIALAVVLPAILLAAMSLRQNGPTEAAPIRLSD